MLHLYVFHSPAVFVVDNGKECFVWVGNKASVDERRKGMEYAHVSRFSYQVKTCIFYFICTFLFAGVVCVCVCMCVCREGMQIKDHLLIYPCIC